MVFMIFWFSVWYDSRFPDILGRNCSMVRVTHLTSKNLLPWSPILMNVNACDLESINFYGPHGRFFRSHRSVL